MTHLLHYAVAFSFACGADAVGRRNTREQLDPAHTTCPGCKAWIINNPEWVPIVDTRPRNMWGTPIEYVDAAEYCPQCEQDNRLGHFSTCPVRGLQ